MLRLAINKNKMYYPLFLDLRYSKCLIIGGGRVGVRKASTLLEAMAQEVLVLDPNGFAEIWDDLQHFTQLKMEKRHFQEQDLHSKSLVFACTAKKDLNTLIAKLCIERGIFCNCVDAPLHGNCIVPALAHAKGTNHNDSTLMAALSTQGASPAWSRLLRTELETWLKPHAPMTSFLGRLRPLVLNLSQKTDTNTALFRALVHSPLRHHLNNGKKKECVLLLEELLPPNLHKYIGELLDGII